MDSDKAFAESDTRFKFVTFCGCVAVVDAEDEEQARRFLTLDFADSLRVMTDADAAAMFR